MTYTYKIANDNLPILRKDLIFKSLFKNKVDRLIFLINEITGYNFIEEDVEFIDTELPLENIFSKNSRLDLFMKTKNGERINIELQNIVTKEFDARRLHYSSLAFSQQMKIGKSYDTKKVISIYIIYDNKNVFPKSLINFNKYDKIALEKEKSGELIKDRVLIDEYIINLAKLDSDNRLKGNIHFFLSLFNVKNIEELDKMCNENEFKDVYDEVRKLTQDEIMAYKNIVKDVEEREYFANLANIKKESKVEAIEEKNRMVVINSFKNNIDIDIISNITNLPTNKVNEILKEENLI